jgi:hypothetical protein
MGLTAKDKRVENYGLVVGSGQTKEGYIVLESGYFEGMESGRYGKRL